MIRAVARGPDGVRIEGHPVEGSGHFIPEEQPRAVVAAILKFVG